MRRLYYIQMIGLLLAGGVCGCKKFVSVSSPATQIVTATTFNSDANATAAQTGIYTQMQNASESFLLSLHCGFLADELTDYSSDPKQLEYYSNSMTAKDVSTPWIDAYPYIYQANAVISGLANTMGVTAVAKQQLAGEAKFLRAFWYFYLVNCYGASPIVTTTDYTVNAMVPRSTASEVYQQIIADLTDAENSLSSNFVDATDSVATTDRVRPTKWAAAALLARTYLFDGIFDSAEQQSTLVINNSNNLFSLCQSLDSVFLANNTEAIWQIPPVQPNSNLAVPEGQYFVLETAPGGGSDYPNATISPQLMNAFETGDLRKAHWIGAYTADNVKFFYFPYKYKVYNTGSIVEYSVVLRLAEQYLIRSEARAQQGNMGGAIEDLNAIRNRAGLAPYGGGMDKASVLTAILHERQVELFTEWGHRWFDLARTGNINAIMSVVTPSKSHGSWSPNDVLFPVPLTEILYDSKLTQNTGY